MDHLPPDFAEALARVIEPGKEAKVARIIEMATLLDDGELQIFLEKFAARVRASPEPIAPHELAQLLHDVIERGRSNAT